MIYLAAVPAEPPQLNAVQRRMLDALREDGVAVARFAELFDEQLWQQAVADIAPFVHEAEQTVRKLGDHPEEKDQVILRRFFVKLTNVHRLPLSGPWLRICASVTLLDVVNAYRGDWTWLQYVDNWYTVPYPSAEKRVASQRWHRDPEDEHLIKALIYFSDVDEEAGPFQYIRSSPSGGRHGHLWPWDEGSNWYPPGEEVEAAVPSEDKLSLTGPVGTLILCDTGGIHRGGFARTKPRILTTATYIGRERRPGEKPLAVDFAGRERSLSPQELFALT